MVARVRGHPEAMSSKITVGYDGSASATEAVLWAAHEAAARNVPLRIVSCYHVPAFTTIVSSWALEEIYAKLREAADADLQKIRAQVEQAQPELAVTCETNPNSPNGVLVDGATSGDLIVVGASGQSGLEGLLLGSTARSVVRHSPCPVVVVRGAVSRGRPDRVVVAVDGSELSDPALAWAGEEADRHGVPLVIVHAWSYPYIPTATYEQTRGLTEVDAAIAVDRAAEATRAKYASPVERVLVEGSPVAAILNSVRDGDLLVLGSHGRGALLSGLLGSVVNSVLDRAEVPVVVVRSDKRK